MILITGASGNVGSEVLKQAVAANLNFRAAYTSAERAAAAPAGVAVVLMDYTKPDTIHAALEGVERAFLVGPPTSIVAELEAGFVNEARRSGLQHVVKLSALGGRAAIFPGLHRDSEAAIEASGVPYTFLRANGFMQNFATYSGATIKAQNAFYGAQGDGAVSHVDIRDVARAAVHVLSGSGHEGQAYALTGPEALTNSQIAEKLTRALGRTIHYADLSLEDFRRALVAAGVPEWSAKAVADLQRFYRDGGARLVDPAVETLTGRKAASFDDFARDYSAVFQPDARAAS